MSIWRCDRESESNKEEMQKAEWRSRDDDTLFADGSAAISVNGMHMSATKSEGYLGSFLGSFLFGGSLAGSYGVNMAIGAGTVGSAGLCGLGWTFAIRTRPYVWKLQLFVFCMICAASLEVIFDFPPFFDLMDAHAIWHGLTPLLFHLLYSVWKDHMAFEEAIVSKQTAQNAESRDRYL